MVFSVTATLFTTIEWFLTTVGIPGLLALMFFESLGLPPLPSEVILPFSGVLLSQGAVGFLGIPFTWVTVVTAAVVGGLLGALGGYLIGQVFGLPALKRFGKRFYIEEEDIDRAHRFFSKHGEGTVFLARLLPLVRAYISYPAGVARMDKPRFVAFTVLGSLPFTVAMVYVGYVLGSNFTRLDPYFTLLDVVGGVTLVVLIAWFFLRYRRRKQLSEGGPRAGVPPPTHP
jgi:membrane protein DedA with SNARE-associated domain